MVIIMEEFTMTYPKVELHCHMDGAIPNRLFVKYCRQDGLLDETISDEEWIRKHVMNETMTLSECMGEFALLTNLLQSEERLEELSFELLKDMYESGTKLVELRFSPQSHVNDHMTMEQAVQAVLRGRKKALEVYPDLVCGFLLCMMNLGQNLGTVLNNTKTGVVLDWEDRKSIARYIDMCWEKHLSGQLTVENADISQFTRRNLTRRMAQLFEKVI